MQWENWKMGRQGARGWERERKGDRRWPAGMFPARCHQLALGKPKRGMRNCICLVVPGGRDAVLVPSSAASPGTAGGSFTQSRAAGIQMGPLTRPGNTEWPDCTPMWVPLSFIVTGAFKITQFFSCIELLLTNTMIYIQIIQYDDLI